MNAALQRATWGIDTRKNERWSRYHAFYYPDAVCVPSLLLSICHWATRGEVQQEVGVENKESAQKEEESDGVILSSKPGRRSN